MADSDSSSFARILTDVLLLVLVCAVCLPPLLVSLDRRPVTRVMEKMAMCSSQETWLEQHGAATFEPDSAAWKLPSFNGHPRVRKPPLLVWLQLLAWHDYSPDTHDTDALVVRARLVSVGMALLLVMGVFWAGRVLAGRQGAVVAALAVGTMWFVQREGRTAAYDIHMAAWISLTMASALWAVLGQSRCRKSGWWLAGVFLACAWMTKGPLALAVTLLPLAIIAATFSEYRWSMIRGMTLMAGIAVLLVAPWFLYLHQQAPRALEVMAREYAAKRSEFQSPLYYVGLLGLVLPWSLWLVRGLLAPFAARAEERSRQLLVGWLWFISLFVMFSIPGAKQQRYILPIVPAAAVLIAMAWQDCGKLTSGKLQKISNGLDSAHWVLLALLSMLIGPLLAGYGWLSAKGWVRPDELATHPVLPALIFGVALTGLTVSGWRLFRKGRTGVAAIVTAVWMLLLTTVLWHSYRKDRVWPHIHEVQEVSDIVNNGPLHYLDAAKRDRWVIGHCSSTMFYLRRVIHPVTPEELPGEEGREVCYLLAAAKDEHASLLGAEGFHFVRTFRAEGKYEMNLWERAARQ